MLAAGCAVGLATFQHFCPLYFANKPYPAAPISTIIRDVARSRTEPCMLPSPDR